jgi:hypothetical protein
MSKDPAYTFPVMPFVESSLNRSPQQGNGFRQRIVVGSDAN